MSLSPSDFAELVVEANLGPSVHNTQPTRWRLEPDGGVLVLEDLARRLPAGDPQGRDADVSHGAAIEGFSLAASARRLAVDVQPLAVGPSAGLRPVARLSFKPGAMPDPLRDMVRVRRTYRGAFAKVHRPAVFDALERAADVCLVSAPDDIRRLSELNDEAGLRTFRDSAFRAELLSWMRLSHRDPRWSLDGLNAEAMAMSPFEAAGAGFVLRPGVFEALDRIGAAGPLVAEAKVVQTASAILLFHRPETESPLLTGRRFYRLWLEVAAAGLSAAPMAVLADDPNARDAVREAFKIHPGRRFITAFRVGFAPQPDHKPKPRLPTLRLIV